MGGGIVTQQLDAEASDAVAGDIKCEQPTMPDRETPIHVYQDREYQ